MTFTIRNMSFPSFLIQMRPMMAFMALVGFACGEPSIDASTAGLTETLTTIDDTDPGPGGGAGDTERCDGQPSEWVAASRVPGEMKLAFSNARDGAYTVPGRLYDGTQLSISWVLTTDVSGAWHQYATPKAGYPNADCSDYWRGAFQSQFSTEGISFDVSQQTFMTLPGDAQRYSASSVPPSSWPSSVALPNEVLRMPGRANGFQFDAYLRADGTIDGHLRQYGSETDPETGDQYFFDLFTFEGHATALR